MQQVQAWLTAHSVVALLVKQEVADSVVSAIQIFWL